MDVRAGLTPRQARALTADVFTDRQVMQAVRTAQQVRERSLAEEAMLLEHWRRMARDARADRAGVAGTARGGT